MERSCKNTLYRNFHITETNKKQITFDNIAMFKSCFLTINFHFFLYIYIFYFLKSIFIYLKWADKYKETLNDLQNPR